MRKNFRRILASLLVIVMLICAVPVGGLTASAVADIPSDAVEFNGHYYKIYEEGMLWTQAKAYCEHIGGHLATITSQAEQEFIESQIKNGSKTGYWLGGTDEKIEGDWKWITDEDFSYTNWAYQQPDNNDCGTENYLMIYKQSNPDIYANTFGFWNDLPDGGSLRYDAGNMGIICEWESNGYTVTGILDSYVISVVLDDGKNWVSEVTIDGKSYSVEKTKLTNQRAEYMKGKKVIATIKNGKIIDIRLLDDLKVNVAPSLSLSDIEYADGKYKATTSNCNVWVENKFNGNRSLLNFISKDPAYTAKIRSITLTSSSDKLKFKESDKIFSWSSKSITIKPESASVQPGSFLSVGNFSLEMPNSYKMTEKTEEITVNCTVQYELNGQLLESSTSGKVKLINNDYKAEERNANSNTNDTLKELNKITGAATLDTNMFLNEQLTIEQRNAVRDVLLTMVALCASDKEAFEKYLDTDTINKVFGTDTKLLGIKSDSVSAAVKIKTKDYGKLDFQFTCKYNNYGLNETPFAFNGDISYEIIGGLKSNKVPEKSGLCGALYGANVSAFAKAVQDVALDELEKSYNMIWGDIANKAADIIFDKTLNRLLKQTKYKSVSGLTWELLITPAKSVTIKCPVDVYVYNSKNELVAYAENDVAVSNDENVIAEATGHEKTFTLFDDTYRLEYVATCEGKMTVEVSEYGTSDSLLSTQTVSDIPLSVGTTYTQNVDTDVLNEHDYKLTSSEEETFELEETYDGMHIHEVRSDWKDIPATCTEDGYRYAFCSICNDWFKEDTNSAIGHIYTSTVTKSPTCTEDGEQVYECSACGDTYSEVLPATDHTDADNDGKCDTCGEEIQPNQPSDPSKDCSCLCHKTGFLGFIYKIVRIFWKLFKINKTCACGAQHY